MSRFKKILINLSSIFILFFQYLPTASYYFGIMSVPFFLYLKLVLRNPVANQDLQFFTFDYGIALLAIVFMVFCWIYLYRHQNDGLVMTGPYKYLRHPQYLVVMVTITLLSRTSYLYTSPIGFKEEVLFENKYWIFIIWGVEIAFYLFIG